MKKMFRYEPDAQMSGSTPGLLGRTGWFLLRSIGDREAYFESILRFSCHNAWLATSRSLGRSWSHASLPQWTTFQEKRRSESLMTQCLWYHPSRLHQVCAARSRLDSTYGRVQVLCLTRKVRQSRLERWRDIHQWQCLSDSILWERMMVARYQKCRS